MKTILVDDEIWMLRQFEEECANIQDIELVGSFRSPVEALQYAEKQRIDLAFLDVEMFEMSGLELSDKLRALYPGLIVIFVSAHDTYMPEAFRQRGADYYVLKPYTKADVESVFERAKLLARRLRKRIYIETFGRFNVYIDGEPLKFSSADAKELLALMVHKRGTALGNKEAFYMMWENRYYNHTSAVSLHKALRRLKDTLDAAGVGDLVIAIPPSEHKINVDLFDCDYYQFLDQDPAVIRRFHGEYMTEWTWGEEMAGYLTAMKEE